MARIEKYIMVPFDFGKESKMALKAALKIGSTLGLRLEVIQFVPPTASVLLPHAGLEAGFGPAISQVELRTGSYPGADDFLRVLEDMKALHRDVHFRQVAESAEQGMAAFFPKDGLALIILHKDIYKGQTLFSTPLVQQVVRESHVPVLALEGDKLPGPFRSIVLPTEEGTFSPHEADFISRWVDAFNSTVHLVNVENARFAKDNGKLYSKMQEAALALGFEKFFVNTTYHEKQAEAIVAFSQKVDADLIMMKADGTAGFERILFGNVTDQVISKPSPPVLAVNVSMT